MDNQFSDAQITSTPVTPADTPPPSVSYPKPTLSQVLLARLQQFAVSALILAVVWVVAFTVLFLVGLRNRDALGFATIIALVAGFFLRTLIPGLAAKVQPSPQSALQPTDSAREIVETVVFVVVLVLLLKSFAAEAFVIPTGSMAETLWGHQKVVKCPQCGLEFPVNCSAEVDPSDGAAPQRVTGCICPNCRQQITLTIPGEPNHEANRTAPGTIPDPGPHNGDRVLVAKFVYDLFVGLPDRLDVVVFKFPGDEGSGHRGVAFPATGPIKKHVPINYIKRLIGLPGETIAIHRGKLFVLSAEKAARLDIVYPDVAEAGDDLGKKTLLWRLGKTHHNDDKAIKAFRDGHFDIIRKKPDNLLSMRRIVYDYDHQAKDLIGPDHQRWRPADNTAWSASDKTAFAHEGTGKGIEWLHYKHLLRDSPGKPQLITDFMGYNTGSEAQEVGNWASDLMVECQVDVAETKGTFALELSRGPMRYQALFDLETGTCSLYPIEFEEKDGKFRQKEGDPKALKSVSTSLKKKGSYHLRFANMDDRLTVWIDDKLVFEDGVELETPRKLLPEKENDMERPVSIGSREAKVTVSKIKVFRDTYYTTARDNNPKEVDCKAFDPKDPKAWAELADVIPSTYYVQPGHFLCMGDNSPQSSDGRSWGLVPQRLLLGRALLVYWPFSRAGRIR